MLEKMKYHPNYNAGGYRSYIIGICGVSIVLYAIQISESKYKRLSSIIFNLYFFFSFSFCFLYLSAGGRSQILCLFSVILLYLIIQKQGFKILFLEMKNKLKLITNKPES